MYSNFIFNERKRKSDIFFELKVGYFIYLHGLIFIFNFETKINRGI